MSCEEESIEEPYYEFGPWYYEQEPDESAYCPFCGKEYEDFSDYGCSYCDVRVYGGE
jgi:hypothetical protein